MQHMKVGVIRPEELANKIEENSENLVVIDCRSGMEYSTWHICGAVNIGGSRNTRREIMSGRATVLNILHDQLGCAYKKEDLIVVYDQCSVESSNLQSLAGRVADELTLCFTHVCFLRGGFIGFQSKFSGLCWTNKHKMPDEDFVAPSQSMTGNQNLHDNMTSGNSVSAARQSTTGNQSLTRSHTMITLATNPSYTDQSLASSGPLGVHQSSSVSQHTSIFPRHSLSGPALPSSKEGPTTVLAYLLLGTQQDALSQPCILKHGITHVINVSTDGPMCPFISPQNFIRIPVLDNFADKITPYFPKAFKFLDDVKVIGGRALVHCSAGISRSPTLAIGYLMKTMDISVTDAYNIVKSSRTSVSPNFNFMGQLTDYEKVLRAVAEENTQSVSIVANKSLQSRQKRRPSRLGFLSTLLKNRTSSSPSRDSNLPSTSKISTSLLPSPSVPFARLGINSPMDESPGIRLDNFPATSLDQLHFQPCQTGLRGVKIKRSATQADNDSSKIRKRLPVLECSSSGDTVTKTGTTLGTSSTDCVVHINRRHSAVLPLTTEHTSVVKCCDCLPEKPLCLSGRSVSYERVNVAAVTQDSCSAAWNASSSSSVKLSDSSCRLQESCHQSTSSLSSANSHSSNLLV